MRTFVYQKERSCHKSRRMMRILVDQNYRRCQKRDRRMKRFVNQKVRRWLNHCPKTRDGSMPTNYLQRQILFPEAR